MIPAECDLSRRILSEQIVFKIIKENLSDDWKVFHSFDYLTRDLHYQLCDGEIDFLLYHHQYGIVILEVKGGAISYRNGQWFQEDRPINPIGQAKRNKYAILQLIENKLLRNVPIKLAHAVCFPSCGKQQVWPVEAQDIVLTIDTLPYIESFVIQLLKDTPTPYNGQGYYLDEEIMQILSPMFEYGSKLKERIDVEEKQFFLFTEEQCAILDMLEHFNMLKICGCAGSGKTIMAVKKAERLALENKKVLLLCFNQLLAKHLKKSVKDNPFITAAAFFDYCIDTLKIPKEQIQQYENNPRLYTDVLPKLLKKHIEQNCLCYDAVIVDEGQDFTKEAWEVISLLPIVDGHFYIFYDPDQNIYTDELYLPDFNIPPVILNKNCRNTKKIFTALQPYQSVKSTIHTTAPDGADIRILHGNCRENLASELTRLVDQEKISLHDIVILGAHSLKNTSIGSNFRVGRFEIVPNALPCRKNEISYFTYMKYKGCESKVVILLDVDDNDSRWSNKHGIYTAMSRAMHKLIMLYSK